MSAVREKLDLAVSNVEVTHFEFSVRALNSGENAGEEARLLHVSVKIPTLTVRSSVRASVEGVIFAAARALEYVADDHAVFFNWE